jgi:beta-galactosidase
VGRFADELLSDERKTAGPPARIVLESDMPQVNSGDRENLAYITAKVVDKDGTVVPNACHTIAFNSYGPGELLPQTWAGHATGLKWEAVAGMTRIALRPTSRVGRARISAYCPGLALGRVEVHVVAKGKRDEMEYSGDAAVYR